VVVLSERHARKGKARTYVDIVRLELGEEHDAGGGRDQVLVGQNHTLHTVYSQYYRPSVLLLLSVINAPSSRREKIILSFRGLQQTAVR
jgi:hypothetical protein